MEKFTEKQLQEFIKAFRLYDRNNDGVISKSEIAFAMRSVGQYPTGAELNEMIAAVDTNRNGLVEFGEFVIMIAYKQERDNEKEKGSN